MSIWSSSILADLSMVSLILSILTLRPNMVFDMDIFKRILSISIFVHGQLVLNTRSYNTSSFKGVLPSATTDTHRSGFPYGGSSNFFLSLSKNINARIEDRSCGEWKQKKTRVIRVIIMLLSIFIKGTFHFKPLMTHLNPIFTQNLYAVSTTCKTYNVGVNKEFGDLKWPLVP